MTPKQFGHVVEGHKRRNKAEMERLATHATWIINHRTPAMGEKNRKMITPSDLLGRKKQRRTFASAAELDAHMREQARENEDEVW